MQVGVIEGFYGRGWRDDDRNELIKRLLPIGYGHYLFAPKHEAKLRSRWREPWSESEFSVISNLASFCRSLNIAFGVGLSPLKLSSIDDLNERDALRLKLAQIDLLAPYWLGVFFDDMPNDRAALAQHQIKTLDFIAQHSSAKKIIMCPSYYSTDDVLQEVFGAMPKHYWRQLGAGIDTRVELFWTGEKVCSEQFTKSNLDFIASEFRREPTLWDNYPVNDGARTSKFLHLKPFSGRESWLENYIAGHFVNPMNQACLSMLPMSTLPLIYQGYGPHEIHRAWCDMAKTLWGDCGAAIIEHAERFQTQGLDLIEEIEKHELLRKYAQYGSAASAEIVDWLADRYQFDPACLTDS